MVVSAFSSISIEDVARADGLTWFQLHVVRATGRKQQDLFPKLNFPKVSSLTVHLCELTPHQTHIKVINIQFADVSWETVDTSVINSQFVQG